MTNPIQIDAELLRDLLDYDPESGALTWQERARQFFRSDREWKRWNTRYAGKPAFTALDTSGYKHGSIFGRLYLSHRVIWKMVTGSDPLEIDHEDQERANNRWSNLREVTHQQNCLNQRRRRNNTSGVQGVHYSNQARKWVAQIRANGRNNYLGIFDTMEAACAARATAEIEHGFHPNHGRERT